MKDIVIKRGTLSELNAHNVNLKAYIVEVEPGVWGIGGINATGDFSGRRQISLLIGPQAGKYTRNDLIAMIADIIPSVR